jgi:hypothetical protein
MAEHAGLDSRVVVGIIAAGRRWSARETPRTVKSMFAVAVEERCDNADQAGVQSEQYLC